MSTGHWRIRPTELQRTLETIRKAGLQVKTVEVCDGTIRIDVTDAKTESDAQTSEDLRKLL